MDEPPAPCVVLVLRLGANRTVAVMAQAPPLWRLFRNFQAFLTPKRVNSLAIEMPALLMQLRGHHAITIPGILPRQLMQTLDQLLLLRRNLLRAITLGASRHTQRLACPTLRHVLLLLDVLDRLSTPRRA